MRDAIGSYPAPQQKKKTSKKVVVSPGGGFPGSRILKPGGHAGWQPGDPGPVPPGYRAPVNRNVDEPPAVRPKPDMGKPGAVMTKQQWVNYHSYNSSPPKGTYEQYVAAHTAAPSSGGVPSSGGFPGGSSVATPSAPPVTGGVSTGVPSNTSTAPASNGPLDAASAYLANQQKGSDALHKQNLQDMLGFQDWLSKQSDTAEGFMQNRFADSQAQYQQSLTAALDTAKGLNTQNQNLAQGVSTPLTQLAGATGAIQSQSVGANEAMSQNARNAAASLMANDRSVNTARVKDLRQMELGLTNKRQSELDKLGLDNIYKQQQLGIDRATAAALGAKNQNDFALGAYQAQTARQKVLSTADYNSQKLNIDRAYKAGQLTLQERTVAVQELNANAGMSGSGAKVAAGARKIANQIRTSFAGPDGKKTPFNAKVPKDVQARTLQSVILAIKNDFPDITGAALRKVIVAEFGAGILNDPQITAPLLAALQSQGISL